MNPRAREMYLAHHLLVRQVHRDSHLGGAPHVRDMCDEPCCIAF